MIRLFGFFLGVATSIGIILLVTGIPEFHREDPALSQQRYAANVELLMARKREAAQALADSVVQSAVSVQEYVEPAETIAIDQTPVHESVAQQAPADTDIASATAGFSFVAPGDTAQMPADMQWYSFWDPFRSRIAASGFVARLEKVTGIDYRIVKVETGVYEVAFAYHDDNERRSKLLQISAATGLDLPDS